MKKICITVPDDIYKYCEQLGEQLSCSTTAATQTIVQLAAKRPKIKQLEQNCLSSELQKQIERYAKSLEITPDQFVQKLIGSYNDVMSFNTSWRKTHGI